MQDNGLGRRYTIPTLFNNLTNAERVYEIPKRLSTHSPTWVVVCGKVCATHVCNSSCCAAAISLYETVRRYRAHLGASGDLTDDEKAAVRELFYRRSVKASDLIVGE